MIATFAVSVIAVEDGGVIDEEGGAVGQPDAPCATTAAEKTSDPTTAPAIKSAIDRIAYLLLIPLTTAAILAKCRWDVCYPHYPCLQHVRHASARNKDKRRTSGGDRVRWVR
jgi:hypothetical protein